MPVREEIVLYTIHCAHLILSMPLLLAPPSGVGEVEDVYGLAIVRYCGSGVARTQGVSVRYGALRPGSAFMR